MMAKQPMLKFVKIDREMPQKRAADTRNKDFSEIYAEFAAEKAKEQASLHSFPTRRSSDHRKSVV